MSEIYVEPVGLSQSLELYLEGKRLDKEIAQLVAIANNPNATSTERVNAAVALSALTNDSNFTQLYDYLPEKKAYCVSAVSDTMTLLGNCVLPGLTDSADTTAAPITLKRMVDDAIANKQTNYKMVAHFDSADNICDTYNVSQKKLKDIIKQRVVGYVVVKGEGKDPVYGSDIGKVITLDDGRNIFMSETNHSCPASTSYDLTITGTVSQMNCIKSPTPADASLTSKYC
jgi:hypothetical protein